MTEKTFLSKDGKSTIHYYLWEPAGEPAAILQITHGMAEHMQRYAPFAEYLNTYGILVCGHDHIGHGKSAAPEDWGYFGENDGWKIFVQDVEQLHQIMKVQYMDVPYFLMGHSMGSFVARAWLAMYGKGVDGAIIMGTAGANPALGVAKTLVKTIRKSKGSRHISGLLTKLAFGSYNKRISPSRTPFDWLTRDGEIVDKYIADPACGFTFTAAGYADLFNLIGYISTDSWYKLVPKNLPILFVAGAEDPVGAYGAGPAEVAEGLDNAGCKDVSLIMYEGMRHEILNEFGKEAVYEDLRRFILGEEALGADDTGEEAPAEAPAVEAVEEAVETAEEVKDAVEETVTEAEAEPEKVHYDPEIKDDRHIEEIVRETAGGPHTGNPDLSGEEKAEVPHRGVRKTEETYDPEWNGIAGAVETEAAAAEEIIPEEEVPAGPAVHVDMDPEDRRSAPEKAFETAETVDQASPDISGEEKTEVPHRGIRGLYETYDGPASEAADRAADRIKKISDMAEDLASKYNG